MKGLLAFLSSSGNTGVAVGLPAGQNMVEGTEATLFVGAASAKAGWRKAWVATLAGLVTLAPYLAGLWFLYKYEPGQYIDYAIAVLIFGIGVHEVMEGLEDRPRRAGARRHALDGPLGLDPADATQIERFQSEHGLEADGVIGPQTRGALLAELRRRGEEPEANRLGVDVTDEASVTAFQSRVGLDPDGIVGARTQGALAAEAARALPDPADPADVRRFQRRCGLAETGVVDARTQGALVVARLDPGEGEGPSAPAGRRRFVGRPGRDRLAARPDTGLGDLYGVDLTSGEDVTRFQRACGLPETGVVDARTQGALRAELERRHRALELDAADPVSVERFQVAHHLEVTGVVDERTQAAMRAERTSVEATSGDERAVVGLDPTDPGSIERFQALHGLERTGEIDEGTREALRRSLEWTAGVDPGDGASVARLQSAHGLEPTGTVDDETQGVLRLYRSELAGRHGIDPDQVADEVPYPLDPTDAGSISAFQRAHGLAETGEIGPDTRAALQAALEARARERIEEADSAEDGGGFFSTYKDAWPAYLGIVLEGGEAGLFTIGVATGTGASYAAAIAGGAAFVAPWVAFAFLRGWIESWPKWVFELTIGAILAAAATIFGLFRATGIFGG